MLDHADPDCRVAKLPPADRAHEGPTAAGELSTSVGWCLAAMPTAASFSSTDGRPPRYFAWSPATAIIEFYGRFSAAALIAHRGMVVLNAPRPRAQSAEEFRWAVGRYGFW